MSNVRAKERKPSKELKYILPNKIHNQIIEMGKIKRFTYFPKEQRDTYEHFLRLTNDLIDDMAKVRHYNNNFLDYYHELVDALGHVIFTCDALGNAIMTYYEEMKFNDACDKETKKAASRTNKLGITVAEFRKKIKDHLKQTKVKYKKKKREQSDNS